MMETYFGMVRSPADAIKLFEACRLGLLPRVQRRLSEKERQAIRHGSVFVWDEREAGMRRWTDGKSWSASRVSGSFLTYREMEGKRGNGTGGGRRCAGKTPDSSRGSDEDQDCGEMGGYTYKADGLTKQSFSIATTNEQHLHLISYHSRNPQEQSRLQQPTSDPTLRHIVPVKGLYPESSLNDLPVAIPRATMQPRAITPQLPGPPPQHAQHQPPPPHHGYSPQQHSQHPQYQHHQQQQPPHTYPPQQHSPHQPPPHAYSQQQQQQHHHPHQLPPPSHTYAQQHHQQLQNSHQPQPPPPNAQSYPPQYAQNGYSFPLSPMTTPPYSHGYHSASGPPQTQLPPISSHPQPAYSSPQQPPYHNAPTNPPYDRATLPLPQVSGPAPPRSGLSMAPHGFPPHQPRVPPIDSPDSRSGLYPRELVHDGGRNPQGPLPSLSQTTQNVPSIVTPPLRGVSGSPTRSPYTEGSATNGAPTKIKKASLSDLLHHPTPVKSEPGSANTGSNSTNGSPSPSTGGLGNNLAGMGQPQQSRPHSDVNALGFLDRNFCA